jgi:hypothetical protein
LRPEKLQVRIRQLHHADVTNRLVTLEMVRAELAPLAYVDIRGAGAGRGTLRRL